MLIQADARQIPLKDESVQMICTSPPYWGLRDYGIAPQIWPDFNDVGADLRVRPICEHKFGEQITASAAGYDVGEKGRWNHRVNGRGEAQERILAKEPGWTRKNIGQGNFCQLCSAWRGSLGLEPTPDLYVEHVVEIFREVKRVLRKDGVVWLNLGDTYQGGNRGTWGDTRGGESPVQQSNLGSDTVGAPNRFPILGLKPKDLCGIPWRVVRALQEPYYTGTIKRLEDRVWLASMIDGEGCMFIHKRKVGQNNGQGYERKYDTYGAGLEVANTHESIVRRCKEITGRGSICFVDKESRMKNRNQRLFRWNLRSNECRKVIQEIYPHFVGKQHEARLVLSCPSSGPDAEKAHASLIKLHNGFPADIDFPPPRSMYEPGWYLRSDIIWSKNNPMPESVTDRPTRSHEYLFLLAKSERYYFDQEAVKEPSRASEESIKRAEYGRYYRDDGKAKRNTRTGKPDYLQLAGNDYGYAGSGRNVRSVWTIATQPYSEAHFATFPEDLVKPCILAGTSHKGCCPKCGTPWERVVESSETFESGSGRSGNPISGKQNLAASETNSTPDIRMGPTMATVTLGWKPGCKCGVKETRACVVFDPFAGSGTAVKVAQDLGRIGIGMDLKPEYLAMAKKRTAQQGFGKLLAGSIL